MDIEDLIDEFVGGAVLVLIAGVFIYALAAFGNAASSMPGGGAQAVSTTNYGILAIMTIVGLAGVGGFIKLAQWITEAFEGQW